MISKKEPKQIAQEWCQSKDIFHLKTDQQQARILNDATDLVNYTLQMVNETTDDQPKGEAIYPGSYYQPLFNHMSKNHNMPLLQGEMDEIIRVVKEMTDQPDLLPFQWPIPDGMEVVTRDGRKVEQLVRFQGVEKDCFAGVIQGNKHISSWYDDGMYAHPVANENDLFLRRKEKKVWVVEDGNENSLMAMYLHQRSHINKWLASNPGAKLYEATLKPVV